MNAIVLFVSLKSIMKVSNRRWVWCVIFFRIFCDIAYLTLCILIYFWEHDLKEELFSKIILNLNNCTDKRTKNVAHLLDFLGQITQINHNDRVHIILSFSYLGVFIIQISYLIIKIVSANRERRKYEQIADNEASLLHSERKKSEKRHTLAEEEDIKDTTIFDIVN